jgi:hypothetical protein
MTMTENIPPECFTDEAFFYVYPLAHCAGWTDNAIKKAIGNYKKIEIEGSRAGTSLRTIMMKLITPAYPQILDKYGILKEEVDPKLRGFEEIIRVFYINKVSSKDIFYFFGFPCGLDFIDLVHNYELDLDRGKINGNL